MQRTGRTSALKESCERRASAIWSAVLTRVVWVEAGVGFGEGGGSSSSHAWAVELTAGVDA